MSIPTNYSFTRYLSAKKSVDDRALNQHVWQSLIRTLPPTTPGAPLRVLEVGAGIGTMVERFLSRSRISNVVYTAIDAQAVNIAEARQRLPRWAADQGFRLTENSPHWLHLQQSDQELFIETEVINCFQFIAREQSQRTWDLLIAQAFLDLVDVQTALPVLLSTLRPGALFTFTITFDGITSFQPEIDPALDDHIERLYHQTMDQRFVTGKSSGDSRTGRHLFAYLRAAGAEVLDVGSSDWVVFAGPNGYPADEAYFLHFIIHTIDKALAGHPEIKAERFADWIAQRHTQVEAGTLVYITHQLDFLGRVAVSE